MIFIVPLSLIAAAALVPTRFAGSTALRHLLLALATLFAMLALNAIAMAILTDDAAFAAAAALFLFTSRFLFHERNF